MKNYLLYLLFSLLCLPSRAQTGWDWFRVSSPSNNIEGYLVATDHSNNVYAGFYEYGAGTLYLNFGPTVGVSNPMLYTESVVVKYDSAGNALWALPLHGDGALIGMTVSPANNLVLFGSFADSVQIGSFMLHGTNGEYYLAEVSPSGTVNWAFTDGGNCRCGFNMGWYYGLSGGVGTDAQGNIYVSSNFTGKSINIGSFTLTNADTAGSGEIFVAKYSFMQAGWRAVWAKRVGGVKDDESRYFTVSSNGESYCAGVSQSPSFSFGGSTVMGPAASLGLAGFLLKFDKNGNAIWGEGSGTHMNEPQGVAIDQAGDIYVTGAFKDTLPIGGSVVYDPVNGGKLYLAKLDGDDHLLWSKTAVQPPGSATPNAYISTRAITTDDCNNVWIDGSMGFADHKVYYFLLDGHRIDSPVKANAYPHFEQDPGFVAGFTSSGQFISAASIQSGFDDMSSLATTPGGNLYLAGDYVGGYLIARSDTVIDTSNKERMMLLKYRYDTIGCYRTATADPGHDARLRLFPNPAAGEAFIQSDDPFPEGAEATLVDITGRKVRTWMLTGTYTGISLSNIQSGVYLCRVTYPGTFAATLKLIVE